VQTLLLQGLGLGLLGLLPAPVHDLDVVVEDGRDDGNQVSLDDSGADVLRSSDADIDDTLEGQVPFPHVHHILTPPLLQNAHQPLDAAIDRQDIPYAGGGGCEVSEVVQGVDEREGGGAVEGSAVIQGGGDADRGLVDIGDAEIDFSHDENRAARLRRVRRSPSSGKRFRGLRRRFLYNYDAASTRSREEGSRRISGWRRRLGRRLLMNSM
jgi:hypothetical protein